MTWTVVAFYRFVALPSCEKMRDIIKPFCTQRDLCGTVLLAPEGINGTIAGSAGAIGEFVAELDRLLGIQQGEVKYSTSAEKPFSRLKVRVRPEIITMRAPEADPSQRVGTYVDAKDWNGAISDPEVLVVDTRNRYETRLGSFRGAVDPEIESFTQFKDFVRERLDPRRHKRVAMFCTGGIRCEKASSYLLANGFETVLHLRGGILRYLEEVEARDSLWQGSCYVFDGRVAVDTGLQEADWTACFGCGAPVSQAERNDPRFEEGVSCSRCHEALDETRRTSLRSRHRAMTRPE